MEALKASSQRRKRFLLEQKCLIISAHIFQKNNKNEDINFHIVLDICPFRKGLLLLPFGDRPILVTPDGIMPLMTYLLCCTYFFFIDLDAQARLRWSLHKSIFVVEDPRIY
jgi:hypothetical protein